MEKKQTLRYSDRELDLIKATFAENFDMIKALRKHMTQLPMSEREEVLLIKNFKNNDELMGIMRKSFLPTIDGNAPLNQIIDLWITLKLDDKGPEEALPFIMARQMVIDIMDERLKALNGEETKPILMTDLTPGDGKSPMEIYVDLFARNTIIQHVEQQLYQMEILGGLKDETPEQMKERLTKNSSK